MAQYLIESVRLFCIVVLGLILLGACTRPDLAEQPLREIGDGVWIELGADDEVQATYLLESAPEIDAETDLDSDVGRAAMVSAFRAFVLENRRTYGVESEKDLPDFEIVGQVGLAQQPDPQANPDPVVPAPDVAFDIRTLRLAQSHRKVRLLDREIAIQFYNRRLWAIVGPLYPRHRFQNAVDAALKAL